MSGSPREIRRPAQGEGLLARKREMRGTRLRPGSPPGGRGAAGSPPRGRFGSPFARGKAGGKKPAPKRKPPAADAAAQPEKPAETRYSEAELLQKREVERCLRRLYEEHGGDSMSYNSYLNLVRRLRIVEGVPNASLVLEKTRPPEGRRMTWSDFKICLQVLALNKYPNESSTDAFDRVVVDAVSWWLTEGSRSASPHDVLPPHVNGIGLVPTDGRTLVLTEPDELEAEAPRPARAGFPGVVGSSHAPHNPEGETRTARTNSANSSLPGPSATQPTGKDSASRSVSSTLKLLDVSQTWRTHRSSAKSESHSHSPVSVRDVLPGTPFNTRHPHTDRRESSRSKSREHRRGCSVLCGDWLPPEMQGFYRIYCEDHVAHGRGARESFCAFAESALRAWQPGSGRASIRDLAVRTCTECDEAGLVDSHEPAFAYPSFVAAFTVLAKLLFPLSPPPVAQQLVIQIGLSASDAPLGITNSYALL